MYGNPKLLAFAVVMLTGAIASGQETPQTAALQAMHEVLDKGDYAGFYEDWFHRPKGVPGPSAEQFEQHMKSDEGKRLTQLFAEVLQAVKAEAGPDVLTVEESKQRSKRPAGKDPAPSDDAVETVYSYTLPKVKTKRNKMGQFWDLELILVGGKWKFLDMD